MMLVEDYLRAVGLQLPREGREDILAELRDLVLTRIEAREEAVGRPLTEAEIEAVLREVGHPLMVAGRYGSGPQHVVGPALYPYWLFGVKAAIAIASAIVCVGLLARLGAGEYPWHAIPQAIGAGVQGAIMIVGVATVAAWLVERRHVQVDYLDNWRVKDLRVLELAAWDLDGWRDRARSWAGRRADGLPAAQSRRQPRGVAGDAIGNMAFGLVFLLWWVGAIHLFGGGMDDFREVGLEPGALATFDWLGLKALIFAPGLVYATALMGQGLFILLRPEALRVRGVFNVLIGAGVVGMAWWLMYASPLAPQAAVGSVVELIARTRRTFQDGPPFDLAGAITLALAISAAGGAVRMLKGLWQLVAPHEAFSPRAPAGAARSSSL